MHLALALALLLSAEPYLGSSVARREADGTWTCGGFCHTPGNADGGECRVPAYAKGQPSKDACESELRRQCAASKPPPGGCHVGRTP